MLNGLKILLVANTDWYIFNFRLSLARFLREQGAEVAIVTPPGRFVERLEQAGFRWIHWQVGRQSIAPWKELAALSHLERIYRREKPTLVHHHTIKPVLYGSMAAHRAGVPLVINSITGRGHVFVNNNLYSRLMRQVIKRLYRRAFSLPHCMVICENQSDQQYFIDTNLIAPEQTRLIEGVGVDAEHFVPLPEPPGVPVVLFAARMLWDKGVGVLVDAARRLKNTTSVQIALVGQPDPGNPASIAESQLRAWEAEGLIEWWGFSDDIRQAYARSHIVTLPTSYGEGVPTVLLEAAACGRPVIASDIPGCRSVVHPGKNGFLVPTNDSAALAESIRCLAADKQLRQEMGAYSRQLVLQKFTIQHVNNGTWQVYRDLASQAGITIDSTVPHLAMPSVYRRIAG
jgi:glycosyltransferase involved in cell wall biosynthesis